MPSGRIGLVPTHLNRLTESVTTVSFTAPSPCLWLCRNAPRVAQGGADGKSYTCGRTGYSQQDIAIYCNRVRLEPVSMGENSMRIVALEEHYTVPRIAAGIAPDV